ncbi:5489_t:CDS:2 [Paraglomus occultum]|uniref:5489_t:CDS:1 n=1 Tax=Paraglomus occultum TaxID=144539 RepID=A0A9N8WD91_9GLOM|nr:5489_t:CDS:2 [Paraglomus occultum]
MVLEAVSGHIATVFGATGFLGRYLVSKLAKHGTQVVIPYRDEDAKRFLKVTGDLGQIVSLEFDARNEQNIIEAVRHSDIVYNLIGRAYETKNFKYSQVHVDVAGRIAAICREQGVSRLVHVSALNADVNSPSEFLKTKALGEKVVKAAFPDVTIVRPGWLYGIDDKFLNRMGMTEGYQFLINRGQTRVRPVHVEDVARALEKMEGDESTVGQTYELFGSQEYTFGEVHDIVDSLIKRRTVRINVPTRIALRFTKLLSLLPWPYISPDEIIRMGISDQISPGAKTFEDLGIAPKDLEASALTVVRRYRQNSWFDAPPPDPRVGKFKTDHIVY